MLTQVRVTSVVPSTNWADKRGKINVLSRYFERVYLLSHKDISVPRENIRYLAHFETF